MHPCSPTACNPVDPSDHEPPLPPLQSEIDAAYSVKVFLDHHPGRHRSIKILAHQSGLSEQRLRAAFEWAFDEQLDLYWAKMQWKELTI